MVKHIPVLLKESIRGLNIKKNGLYIDCNLGGGGHTSEILKAGGKVVAFDVDDEMIEKAKVKFVHEIDSGDLTIICENFANIRKVIHKMGVNDNEIDGILYDLGLSTFQIKESGKGFSFSDETNLDMRMDRNLSVTAEDLIIGLSEKELAKLIKKYGEDPQAKNFAHAIKEYISQSSNITPIGMAEAIKRASKYKESRIHPATRVFQALRIAVNSELENLELSLHDAALLLKPQGRMAVISFHSLEDEIVKDFVRSHQNNDFELKLLNKKPVAPTGLEMDINNSSRSGKLNIIEKQVIK